MAYWLLENDRATYAVDWDVVNRLVRGGRAGDAHGSDVADLGDSST